ncbi:MAG: phytanoyl-CoA dioxygenase family protein [Actinomycetota bacterium]
MAIPPNVEPLFGGVIDREPDFEAFVAVCSDPVGSTDPATSDEVILGVPVYDGDRLRSLVEGQDSGAAPAVAAELADVLGSGSGAILVRRMWSDQGVLDAMTGALLAIAERERTEGDGFDHFAASGANSRAWDVLGKAAKLDPRAHVDYYANPLLDLVCRAWLGPFYQLTAQLNIVHPGGAAQSPHRDYHLGFLSNDDAGRFPVHAHRLSQALTLQAGIAHSAMPLESGPTVILPGSQRFAGGYLAWRDQRFIDHFHTHAVQIAMEPGDGLFFNPGLHHGAGSNNTTDRDRIANLLQVSSAFGVPMEAVDWTGIAIATYPSLLEVAESGELDDAHIATCASGYAFPSNLDTDRSDHGLAPSSLQDLLREALASRMTPTEFSEIAQAKANARRPF